MELKEVPQEPIEIEIGSKKLDLTVNDPFWLGNTIAFGYKDHNPKFVIGPHCIFIGNI